MWSEFFFACCAGTLFLVAPGFLILRVLGFTFGRALCAAPLFSSVLISLLSITYDVAGISSNPLSIIVVPAAVFVLFAIVLSVIRRRKAHLAEDDIPLEFIFLYAAIGLALICKGEGNNEEAAKRFENLIKNDPRNGRLYVDLAECYVAMNRKQDAVKVLSDYMKMDSRNIAVRNTLDKLQRN